MNIVKNRGKGQVKRPFLEGREMRIPEDLRRGSVKRNMVGLTGQLDFKSGRKDESRTVPGFLF
jgi:hypothetical protein